jgi:DNA gyrase subunit A
MMVTRRGTVKRIPFVALNTRRRTGIRAITLEEGDQLINVIRTEGDDNIILATAGGMAICFNENDVRPMGRDAAGVRGIMLTGEDVVIGAQKAQEGTTLLTVTENGYGKRTELSEYLRTGPDGEKVAQSRGGKGLKNYNITAKTGPVAGCCLVSETDDVMLIENGGVIIRVPAASINVYKRDVQGVIIMRIEEGNKLVSLERVEALEEETQQ